jgi:23S rRNA (guanosine2251-2'-O)-methyltransferase
VKTQIIYGIHPVAEALRAGRRQVYEILSSREKVPEAIAGLLACHTEITLTRVSNEKLKALAAGEGHQGVAARVSAYPYSSLQEIFAVLERDRTPALLLVLDCLQDPSNLGTLARTALCAGVHGIITPRDRSASATAAVVKASAGAIEHVRLARVINLVRCLQQLKQQGLWVVGLERSARRCLYAGDYQRPLAVVIGAEDRGLRRLVRQTCDELVAIPQGDAFNSLNASVAGAVALFEVLRQRHGN